MEKARRHSRRMTSPQNVFDGHLVLPSEFRLILDKIPK
jgi:hypothetical protein